MPAAASRARRHGLRIRRRPVLPDSGRDRTARSAGLRWRDLPPGETHLAHIPRRFYRAAAHDVDGSGLGLVLVQEILRRHQSHLQIESNAEGNETGTCVRFDLPVLPEEETLAEREGGQP